MPTRMQIMGARGTPQVNILRIACECGARFDHRADRWAVRCPMGHTSNLAPLREHWLQSHRAAGVADDRHSKRL